MGFWCNKVSLGTEWRRGGERSVGLFYCLILSGLNSIVHGGRGTGGMPNNSFKHLLVSQTFKTLGFLHESSIYRTYVFYIFFLQSTLSSENDGQLDSKLKII